MMNKAPEIDFDGNDPFWLKNEGYGLTLYFPAFMPHKSFYLRECLGTDKLVFGIGQDDVPVEFVLTMMHQGRLRSNVNKCGIGPEITPSGRVVMAISIGKWESKEEYTTSWRVTQAAYNWSHSWYRERVMKLWDQAKMAASYFNTPEQDGDIVDVEVVEPEQIT
jgi:hypothetical protein